MGATKLGNTAINVILLVSSLCFVLGLAEFAIRYMLKAYPFEPNQTFEHLSYLTKKDQTLRWRFSPNRGGRNSLGLKNREIGPKQPDQIRILYLGDSPLWGGETSSGKQYTEVIEENLRESHWSDGDVEVINAGIPGYTTYQELEFLKIYGLEMNPAIVILGFVFNDVYYKYLHKPNAERLLGPEPTVHLNRFDVYKFPGRLFARSYVAHWLVFQAEEVARTLTNSPRFPFDERGDFYLAWKEHGWVKTRELLAEMKNLLEERNIQLHIVVKSSL